MRMQRSERSARARAPAPRALETYREQLAKRADERTRDLEARTVEAEARATAAEALAAAEASTRKHSQAALDEEREARAADAEAHQAQWDELLQQLNAAVEAGEAKDAAVTELSVERDALAKRIEDLERAAVESAQEAAASADARDRAHADELARDREEHHARLAAAHEARDESLRTLEMEREEFQRTLEKATRDAEAADALHLAHLAGALADALPAFAAPGGRKRPPPPPPPPGETTG